MNAEQDLNLDWLFHPVAPIDLSWFTDLTSENMDKIAQILVDCCLHKDQVLAHLEKYDPRVVGNELARIASTSAWDTAMSALDLCVSIDLENAYIAITPWLTSPDNNVRAHCCRLLSAVGMLAVETLHDFALHDVDGTVRYFAVDALSEIRDERSASILKSIALNDVGTDYEGRPIMQKAKNALKKFQ